jgi:hypothetical protein
MTTEDANHHIMWQVKIPNEPGLEHVIVRPESNEIHAEGFVLGIADNQPYRLRYHLEWHPNYQFQYAVLQLESDYPQTVRLLRNDEGKWTNGMGKSYPEFEGCYEIDIQVSPISNTFPVRRLGLAVGQSELIQVVYITLPTLALSVQSQRYTRLEDNGTAPRYCYESLSDGFSGEFETDSEGFVTEYTSIYSRVW